MHHAVAEVETIYGLRSRNRLHHDPQAHADHTHQPHLHQLAVIVHAQPKVQAVIHILHHAHHHQSQYGFVQSDLIDQFTVMVHATSSLIVQPHHHQADQPHHHQADHIFVGVDAVQLVTQDNASE